MADPKRTDDLRVMPWWHVLIGVLLAIVLGWLVLDWLLGEANRATGVDVRAILRVDAIRTGLTVVAGTGGGLALLLAARRQWLSERSQRHQEFTAARDHSHRERIQEHTEQVAATSQKNQEEQARRAEYDATERRVTDLFTKAVDLLGSDKAAVRLGGLYALERLAQDNVSQRQTVVAVICAYLRMTDEPDRSPEAGHERERAHTTGSEQEDEVRDKPSAANHEDEVRRSAQRLLTRHLHADTPDSYWPEVRLDLAHTRLVDFDASGCTLADADFTGARFVGTTRFAKARTEGRLTLTRAHFGQATTFEGLTTSGDVMLDESVFDGDATFDRATFGGEFSARRASFASASFSEATFDKTATFDHTSFKGTTSFRSSAFHSGLSIERGRFADYAGFRSTRFEDMAFFRWTAFEGDAYFENAVFEGAVNLGRAEFHARASFAGATMKRRPNIDHVRAAANQTHVWPPGTTAEKEDDDWIVLVDHRA
ncbi:pentapeptide repeat-containing protein [Asanoa iriomotensis]|uniref:pentapeptide repeat-containing protein n=1 Tax=Asanoa iriomotensis TaxID=234613 RepID=UPI0019433ABB|nr:pentapeptide repeat-containing protein [Asanoa iriomotensis]